MFHRGLICGFLLLPAFAFGVDVSSLPFVFERNAGQASHGVRFVARRPGIDVFFSPDRVDFVLKQSGVSLKFINPLKQTTISGENITGGASNYMVGNDPSRWITRVAHYQQVRYRQIYAGVDAVFYISGILLASY